MAQILAPDLAGLGFDLTQFPRVPKKWANVLADAEAVRLAFAQVRTFGHITNPPEEGDEDYMEDGNPVGALAFLLWDEVELPLTLVEHYEVHCYEGEGASEETFRYVVRADDTRALKRLIALFKAIVAAHSALSKLLTHFPEWKQGDPDTLPPARAKEIHV